ncbi:hypothetical protein, partial [Stenotrophomonas maltophilia]|uniref:hypothetical protein n=1 Tax=Stenotrophomonas maltophilia TaxID=40324 RepID=UPI001953F9BA
PTLSLMLDLAVAADPEARFVDAAAALRRLRAELPARAPVDLARTEVAAEPEPLRPNVVPWVKDILSA